MIAAIVLLLCGAAAAVAVAAVAGLSAVGFARLYRAERSGRIAAEARADEAELQLARARALVSALAPIALRDAAARCQVARC